MDLQKFNVAGIELVGVGNIISASGLKGALKIRPSFFTPQELCALLKSAGFFYIADGKTFPVKLRYEGAGIRQKHLVLNRTDLSTDVSAAKGVIAVKNDAFKEYVRASKNIIMYLGHTVVDDRLGILGVVDGVMRGVQDAVTVGRIIIPFVKPVIKDIDDEKMLIHTSLPGGLTDDF